MLEGQPMSAKKPRRSKSPANRKIRKKTARPKRRPGLQSYADDGIALQNLFDLLSEYIAADQCALRIYGILLQRARRVEMKKWLRGIVEQTERHIDLLQGAVRDLGGNPVYVSPTAEVQHERARTILSLEVPEAYRAVSDLESLLMTEAKQVADFRFLRAILPFIEMRHAAEVLSEVVEEIEPEVEVHADRAASLRNDLLLERLRLPPAYREDEAA